MRLMHLGRLSLALWHLRQLLLGRHYHAARSLPEAIRDSRQGWSRLYRLVQALSEAKLGEYYEVAMARAWQMLLLPASCCRFNRKLQPPLGCSVPFDAAVILHFRGGDTGPTYGHAINNNTVGQSLSE